MAAWVDEVMAWFDAHRRDLPWRRDPRDPWAVLVSEVMLQQTPVGRVIPSYEAWLARWPDAGSLAPEPPGEAVRMWGRLGYPRRALRLHSAAVAIASRHGGVVPSSYEALIALPGVGDYTAAAVMAFAYRSRIPVLDTNVRRVLARAQRGQAFPDGGAPRAAERRHLAQALPDEPAAAAHASEAIMELGALVCTARTPRCPECPLRDDCEWFALGRPANRPPPGRQPAFAGSDRQARGVLMAALRDAEGPVAAAVLLSVWSDHDQAQRALRSLDADGLVVLDGGVARLPG